MINYEREAIGIEVADGGDFDKLSVVLDATVSNNTWYRINVLFTRTQDPLSFPTLGRDGRV